MSWELVVDDFVKKVLKRIPQRDVERVLSVIKELAINPYAGDIEKIQGEKNVWRRRIGSYRILYEVYIAEKIIYVVEVRRRTSNTY